MPEVRALVLEKANHLSLRDIDLRQDPRSGEVKIAIDTVGICGSDVHYFKHGRIGHFVLNEPMVLGHEASGTIVECGDGVTNVKVGDRVCMEPGIPDPLSRASRLGLYNVDPAVQFWATPPVHGCLTQHVVHPSQLCFKLPNNVSFGEGAMVEPLAIGVQAALKASIKPGDIAAVFGAGPIGMMVALAALASGAAKVIIAEPSPIKREIIGRYACIETIDPAKVTLSQALRSTTNDWGADIVFECSGAAGPILELASVVRPGGTVVLVGMPVSAVQIDIVGLQSREARIETVFRYANVFDRAVELIASGKIDLKPLISATIDFEESIKAFERAAEQRPGDVKLQIKI